VLVVGVEAIASLVTTKPEGAALVPHLVLLAGVGVAFPGFFSLQPNEARVLLLFGGYRGAVRHSGFHWGNPFYSNGSASAGPRRRPSSSTMSGARRW
jgi:hypothetical protein